MTHSIRIVFCSMLILLVSGCFPEEERGLWPAVPAATTIKTDFEARPLPEIPLPNDIATRYDKTADSYLGFVHIGSLRLWHRHFVNRA